YRATKQIDKLEAAACVGDPLFDVTAPDGVRHRVWKATGAGAQAVVDAFAKVPALYIADGHHRAASAARAREALTGKSSEADWFIAVAFPDNQMQILPYNRLVKDLAGQSPEALLAAISALAPVTPGA